VLPLVVALVLKLWLLALLQLHVQLLALLLQLLAMQLQLLVLVL
jgi:hypothetical protein